MDENETQPVRLRFNGIRRGLSLDDEQQKTVVELLNRRMVKNEDRQVVVVAAFQSSI